MPVRDEDVKVRKVFGNTSNGMWEVEMFVSEWKPTFTIFPKTTINGVKTRPFTTVYTRQKEKYEKGQKILTTEWLTPGEYVMGILKEDDSI